MIGPLKPRFDLSVGRYLSNSPTPQQKSCLKKFFSDLASGPVRKRYKKIGQTILIATCDHVVKIERDGSVVSSIELGLTL